MDLKQLFNLEGKNIVITGGAGHLGSAMSEALAAFGANLFILGKNEEKNSQFALRLKEHYNSKICKGFAFDIRNENSVCDVWEKIQQTTEHIDILVNNANYSCAKPLHEYTFNEWNVGIDGTIGGVFRMTQYALSYMMKQQNGNIINIASMYGMVAPNMDIYGDSGQNNPANYGVGKAAIIQFTRYIACVYAKYGIRANAISPGPFPNKIVQKDGRFINELCKKNPMNRIGNPSDLQGIIVYLASDASSYTNGQNIAVDGGWTSW